MMRKKIPLKFQWLFSIGLISTVSFVCYLASGLIGYRVIALILLLSVSTLAMFFEILPVLISAMLSALIWNYFFIPPTFTFHIDTPEDLLMFLMYFVIALLNAVLTIKIREQEKRARDKEEKEKSIELYNTLLNSLSHELKTPIATIIGGVDTLKENTNLLSEQNKVELLLELEKAGLRLNRQVENLLNMNRIESGMLKIQKDWTDINEMIFYIVQQFSETTTHNIIYIPHEELPLIKIDRGLIENVIHNIIYNAILYTPSHTNIYIEVEVEQGIFKFDISDEGSGFLDEHIDKVFHKFYRLENSKTGGTGLGLSIAKGFIEAHNGEIFLSNREHKGARFSINIPTETTYIKNINNE